MFRSVVQGNFSGDTVAVCDLGTFSGLILMARRSGSRLTSVREEIHTIDLLSGAGRNQRLSPAALHRAAGFVRRFQMLADQIGIRRGIVVCTSAVRDAPNGEWFAKSLGDATNFPIRVLSARQEARLSALGAMTGLRSSSRPSVVVDIGGGSTEVIFQKSGRVDLRLIGCGAARATADWADDLKGPFKLRAAALSQRTARVMNDLPDGAGHGRRAIGVGGTITTLAAMHARLGKFDAGILHGTILTREWIARQADRLAVMDPDAIARHIPFAIDRARVLTAGTFLWVGVLNRLGADRVVVSVRGLRWGVAARLLETSRL